MAVRILMPALSPTMTEGTLARWLKKTGDSVVSGDVIAEIETDKATMELEVADDGTLARILVEEGSEGIPVNQVIAVLSESGDDDAAVDDAAAEKAAVAAAGSGKTSSGRGEAKPQGEDAGEEGKKASGPGKTPAGAERAGKTDDTGRADATGAAGNGRQRVFASPLARRMAEQESLDLNALSGSGPRGRIVKADIEAALQSGAGRSPGAGRLAGGPASAMAVTPDFDLLPPHEALRHTAMRRVIAERMSLSKQTAPHFELTVDCQIDRLLAIRKELNDKAKADKEAGREATPLSVNDFVIRAAGLALKQVPEANAMWTPDALLRFQRADISVAVAVEGGLVTPVVRGVESRGLGEISREVRTLAKKARDGKLAPEEYQGGTFSVSNLGMYGVRQFNAVINPPQGAILAVGAGEPRPVVRDGALAVATVMTCTLSVDHRAMDGVIGAQFLAAFRALIENPLTMLL
ncbi:MAG: pyruvate dehydrogenase complex dihydrolipoamide acetyltransferase [Alphaproteobacteria bacterium]